MFAPQVAYEQEHCRKATACEKRGDDAGSESESGGGHVGQTEQPAHDEGGGAGLYRIVSVCVPGVIDAQRREKDSAHQHDKPEDGKRKDWSAPAFVDT